jgi:hypothetical protein
MTMRETRYVKGISQKEKTVMSSIANDEIRTTRYKA